MDTTIADGIDWVGYVDWNAREFHGYETPRGATYNAYLVQDEKTVLVDAVRDTAADSLLANIARRVDFEQVDYVVCNHAEPDHTGALPRVLQALPRAVLLCNRRCRETLGRHYDTRGWRFQRVRSGERLSIGRRTLQFLDTPRVHWPESMCTFIPEERLLFSMDIFGQHYATSRRFDDENSLPIAMEEAKIYFANIMLPYAKYAARSVGQIDRLDVGTIAPSHGVIWRRFSDDIRSAYRAWTAGQKENKVVVLYDTMWGGVARMAEAVMEGASGDRVDAKLLPVRDTSLARIATEVMDAAAVAVGCPTLNLEMTPHMAAALVYLKGLKPRNKAGAVFGTSGWSEGGPEKSHAVLEAMRWEMLRDPLKVKWSPSIDDLQQCRQLGRQLAARAAAGVSSTG